MVQRALFLDDLSGTTFASVLGAVADGRVTREASSSASGPSKKKKKGNTQRDPPQAEASLGQCKKGPLSIEAVDKEDCDADEKPRQHLHSSMPAQQNDLGAADSGMSAQPDDLAQQDDAGADSGMYAEQQSLLGDAGSSKRRVKRKASKASMLPDEADADGSAASTKKRTFVEDQRTRCILISKPEGHQQEFW